MPVQSLPKQAGVSHRRQRQERRAKACRECRAWCGNTPFRTGKLGGVTRQEPVERLIASEPGQGWQDAKRVRGEKQDLRWMLSVPARLGIEKGERIGRPRIFGQGIVIEPRGSRQ